MMTRRTQIALFALIAVAACGACGLYFFPLVNVTGYQFKVVSTSELFEVPWLVDSTSAANLFRQPLEDMSQALLDSFPEFSEVNCRINLSREVVCECSTKKPIALICLPQVCGLTSRCEIIPLQNCGDVESLIIITGLELDCVRDFEPVMSTELHRAISICDLLNTHFPNLNNMISQMDFGSNSAPVLYFRDSNVRAVIGMGNYEEKFRYLSGMIELLPFVPVSDLDFRFGRSVVARDRI